MRDADKGEENDYCRRVDVLKDNEARHDTEVLHMKHLFGSLIEVTVVQVSVKMIVRWSTLYCRGKSIDCSRSQVVEEGPSKKVRLQELLNPHSFGIR